MSFTEEIFQLNAPYANPYQGKAPRVLFVCSAGILRSATAAQVAYKEYGWNTRACGTSERALIRISANLISWAQTIVFVNSENYYYAVELFRGTEFEEVVRSKGVSLDVPDQFAYHDAKLVKIIKDFLKMINVLVVEDSMK